MKNFCELTRFYSVPMSITPFLIALSCALSTPLTMNLWFNAALVLVGIMLVHLGGNLFDDYVDAKSQKYDFNVKNKARLMLDGTYKQSDIEKILFWIFLPAVLIGIYFILLRGSIIFYYMFVTAILCAFYPISSKNGLAEIVIGIIFGPLLINGAYYALTGISSQIVFNLSLSSGIITSILLIVHSLMDFEYDIKTGKKTIPVILENKNLTINFISILIIFAWGILIYTSMNYGINRWIFLPIILTIPVSIKLIFSLYDYINIKNVKFERKWYFGMMENWDSISKSNTQYFMYRFYLARNLAAIFNIVLAFSCLFCFTPLWLWHFFF